ncbi:MAG: chromate transporter [Bacteroidales bacterium]|nr:chromate transporter [Bacteroidales bacterium]
MVRKSDLFWSFFKVGTFTIGGGYAMIPLMQSELVERHGWLGEEEFLDDVALAQSMPGVFAVNMAAMTGYRLRRLGGAAAAIAGNVLMPIVFILLLATVFRAFGDNVYVQRVFMGLRPCVVALIAAPVFNMARSAKVAWSNAWIPAASAAAVWLLGVNPVLVVLAAAAGGWLWWRVAKGGRP